MKATDRITGELAARWADGPISIKGKELSEILIVPQTFGQDAVGGYSHPLEEIRDPVLCNDRKNPRNIVDRSWHFGEIEAVNELDG